MKTLDCMCKNSILASVQLYQLRQVSQFPSWWMNVHPTPPFCFSPHSHLSACNSQSQILLYLHALLLPIPPICSLHSPLSKIKRGERELWNRWHDQVTQNWEMVGMQTRCLLLDLNGGEKAVEWRRESVWWSRWRGRRGATKGINSRQELTVKGNKRQRADTTVGVDGG